MHLDVYESTTIKGPYLLVKRDAGRIEAPASVRAGFVPGQLVKQPRLISTDSIAGLNVGEAIAAIHRDHYYVAAGPIDFSHVIGLRLER